MDNIFNALHPLIQDTLQKQGFTAPTQPQSEAIPHILSGSHTLLIAPTGSGKTEAAVLPVFDKIIRKKEKIQDEDKNKVYVNSAYEDGGAPKGISALYIAPLRALNRDMMERLLHWGKSLGITVAVRHGDTTPYERRKQVLNPPDFLITTPETLQIMLTGSRLRQNLAGIESVIIDEIHELAGSKRGAQLTIGLERLEEVENSPENGFQRIGLSATVGNPTDVAHFLAGTDREAVVVETSLLKRLSFNIIYPHPLESDIEQSRSLNVNAATASHIRTIRDIVNSVDEGASDEDSGDDAENNSSAHPNHSTLIFVNTRQSAEVLASRLKMLNEPIAVHHGSLSKDVRIAAEDDFKIGRIKGLICTSSMELGIDIGEVDRVIQYSSPREVSRLLQRVGRAGHRIGDVSKGTIIALNADDVIESFAIVDLAIQAKSEPVYMHEGALDALANQIVGLVMDFGEIPIQRIFEIVKRAYPYRNLEYDVFEKVVELISERWLIWLEDKNANDGEGEDEDNDAEMGDEDTTDDESDTTVITAGRKRRSWQYYYANLSMISDEKKYAVFDIVSGRTVGSLDEAFVMSYIKEGAMFVTKGEMWRVLEINERIMVEPVASGGDIPNWVGESIPVPYDVAQRVGKIRAELSGLLHFDFGDKAIIEMICNKYHADEESAAAAIELIRSQDSSGATLPTDNRIVIESGGGAVTGDGKGNIVIMNTCFGHRVNDTIAQVIKSLLWARFGEGMSTAIDPYRIKIVLPKYKLISPKMIVDLLLDTKPEYIAPIIAMTMKNTTLMHWKMVHVARKFGVLGKAADHQKYNMGKIIEGYKDTVLYDEVMRDILHTALDIDRTMEVFTKIQSGEIEVLTQQISPVGLAGFDKSNEGMVPEKASPEILEALKTRIMNDKVILFCTNCRKWSLKSRVKSIDDPPVCLICDARSIAVLKPWEEDDLKVAKKNKKTPDTTKLMKRLNKSAALVLSHGKKAVIALAAHGVGPDTASRIIRKQRVDEVDFYRDILAAESNYTRTKRFWK